MAASRKVRIPDSFFAGGEPVLADYLRRKDEGLKFREVGEAAFELAAAFGGDIERQFTTVSLLSPYVLGDAYVQDRVQKLISVDLSGRQVTIQTTSESR